MSALIKTAGRFMLFISVLFLAACSTPTPTLAPTPDLNALRTEVASTVLAKVPEYCAMTPTATPLPSATPTTTATSTATATATASTLTPSAPGVPGSTSGDRAKWVAQTIQDDTRFSPAATFNMTWTIMNSGVTTWTTGYRLRFYSGDPFNAEREIALSKEVGPGQSVDITIPMKAPLKPGEYRSDWVMSNEFRRNFNEPVFLKILVVAPGASLTPTPGGAVTNTPTATQAATTAVPTQTLTPTVAGTP